MKLFKLIHLGHPCRYRRPLGIAALIPCYLAASTAHAQIDHQFDVYVDAFYLYADESEANVAGEGENNELGFKANPRLYTEFGDNWRSLIHAQVFYATDTVELESDEGGRTSDGFVGLREMWLEWSGLTEYPGESIRLGRQRVRLDPGLTVDTDIVAGRWLWDTTLLQASATVAEEIDTFRTDDSELGADEENLQRYLLDVRWQYRYQHFISGHVLHTEGDETSLLQPSLTWIGFSVDSDYHDYRSPRSFHYYLAAHGVNGEITPLSTGTAEDVSGWATDIGLRWRSQTPSGWQVGLQLAATDDDPDGFRQTGLHSNRSRFFGARTRLHRFNEALRADLRNLSVASAYMGWVPEADWELNIVFTGMQLRNPDGEFVSNDLNLQPTGDSKDVGQGVDLVATWYWRKDEAPYLENYELDSYTRLRLSTFALGDAFAGPDADARVHRATLDWVVNF